MERMDLLQQVDDSDAKDCMLDALRLLMKSTPYKDITIKDICAKSGFSRKTFYDNFSKKDDLLEYLAEDLVLGFRMTDNHTNFLQLFQFWYAIREWITLLMENDLWNLVESLSYKMSIPLIRERNWEQMLTSHVQDKELFLEFVNAGCLRLLQRWYETGFQRSPEEMAALVDYILFGSKSDG